MIGGLKEYRVQDGSITTLGEAVVHYAPEDKAMSDGDALKELER